MKQYVILVLFTCTMLVAQGQKYDPFTKETDAFSVAFVQLLNCAVERFVECKGDSLRSTSLMGDDYKLKIHFPNSTLGIIRLRDWDKNAYIEFGGFKRDEEIKAGLQLLSNQIRKALGEQYHSSSPSITSINQFYSFGIKDDNGYFSPNVELFVGRSASIPYLLGQERDDEIKGEKKYFILLKVYGGLPSYQYYVQATSSIPDKVLHQTLKQVYSLAQNDFDSLISPVNRTKSQIILNGYTVNLNFRSQNYVASLIFPAETDTAKRKTSWQYYQSIIQALLGSDYVYHIYNLQGRGYVNYYATKDGNKKPTILLETNENNGQTSFVIKIISPVGHPTKRGLNLNDE